MEDDLPNEGPSAPEVSVTACPDGPLLLRGPFRLLDAEGAPIPKGRRTVALCRCGASSIRPFCDGTHKEIGFTAPGGAERERPRPAPPEQTGEWAAVVSLEPA
ncbi:CDGSH iron-sulfur domain-containing protein [Nocardiopsis sp. ARC36]